MITDMFSDSRGRWLIAPLVALALTACTSTPEPAKATSTPAVAATSTQTATGTATAASPTATGTAGGDSVIIPPVVTGTRYAYTCADSKKFEILAFSAAQERVTLFVEGKTLELKQERSGSGTRHSDGTVTLVSKGVEAFIEQGGVQTYKDCKATRP